MDWRRQRRRDGQQPTEERIVSWDSFQTNTMSRMVAEVSMIPGGGGSDIHAYVARPDGPGPYPGVVLLHHVPGWDEYYRELSRRFAAHGYIAVAPNLFEKFGHGTPSEVASRGRTELTDDSVVADAQAALNWVKAQPGSNGKVGVIGSCSGGRHAVLVASRVEGFGAVADLWGGGVVQPETTPQRPVAPIDLTSQLSAPLIGIFGNDDQNPSPAMVEQHEAALQAAGKTYQFHRYDGAGHGIWYYQGMSYRPQAAMDSWNKVEDWFNQHLT
jgi:carboxymethylenebutenolidase